MGKLYIVATPIGNLADISLRGLEVLATVDLVLCEDTRVTKRLLDHYRIKVKTLSYHQHSKIEKVEEIVGLLRAGKDIALVSDAGTPGIADPGNKLVAQLLVEFGEAIDIVPVPGASALASSASVAGIAMDRFLFLGFPPLKNKRNKFFAEVVKADYPVIFYESPYRIVKTLKELDLKVKDKEKVKLVVCRELTKKFETVYRGTIKEVVNKIEKDKVKGEFVVIFSRI